MPYIQPYQTYQQLGVIYTLEAVLNVYWEKGLCWSLCIELCGEIVSG